MEEQANTSNFAYPLIPGGREMVSISIPKQDSVKVNTETEISQSQKRRMEKVPAWLRREVHNKSDYDPAVVSFGPYHHGKPELKFVEDFKPKALQLFVAGSGKDIDFFYSKILEVIHDVRRCYVENSTDEYDDAVFARMMLHDACFFINSLIDDDPKIEKVMTGHLGALVGSLIGRDMHLLENQIPLWFLKLLVHLKFGQDVGEEKLRLLTVELGNEGKFEQTGESNEEDEPLHLLEASRRQLVSYCSKEDETNRCSIFEWLSSQSATIGEACQRHCLSKFRWLGKGENIKDCESNYKSYFHSFCSVTDLKANGIHFSSSPTDSFKDIKFKSSYLYGKLQLPTWLFTKNTKVFFLNVVAFEMYPNTNTDLAVSSYINFMKSLIESPKDVKELREKQILINTFGSDEEVLRVYKDINTYDVDDVDMFYEVRKKIQEHYNKKAKTWLAELINTYFRSPWTAIALLAAIILLCLTLVQTYFTIHPSSN